MSDQIPPAGSGGPQGWQQPHLPPPQRGGMHPVAVILIAVFGGILLLGILAAIAIPSFVNQRERAERASTEASDLAVVGDHVWISNSNQGVVTLVGPNGDPTNGDISVGAAPVDLAGGFKSLWVAGSGSGNVVRLPNEDVQPARIEIPAGRAPFGITTAFGAVWSTDTADGKLIKIDPGTNRVTAKVAVGDEPRGVAAGRSAVWVANSGSGTVTRVDQPRGPQPEPRDFNAGGAFCHDLTVGAGRVWVASPPSRSVVTLDERSGRVVGRPIKLPDAPISIEASRGAIWVAGEAGVVSRIDSRTRRVTGSVQVGGALSDIAYDDREVLVLDRSGHVTRLTPGEFIESPIGDAA